MEQFLLTEKYKKNIFSLDIDLYQRGITMAQLLRQSETQKIAHSPTLNTVMMVETMLKSAGMLMSVADIKRKLPRKVMHQTLLQILDYLQLSGKIVIGTKGILWVFTERKEMEKLIRRGTEV